MEFDPRVEDGLREMIRLLLGIPDADLPEFRDDPYDNGMRMKIQRGLDGGHTGGELLLSTLARMDGRELDQFRERNGKKWRQETTRRFLEQYDTGIGLHFAYHPYTGITQDISRDWTVRYNGIVPMGHLAHFFTPEERDASLRDQDTGERWPESEVWACGTGEALFHILRLQQLGGGPRTSISWCDCDGPCDPERECRKADQILEKVYRDFLEWEKST